MDVCEWGKRKLACGLLDQGGCSYSRADLEEANFLFITRSPEPRTEPGQSRCSIRLPGE